MTATRTASMRVMMLPNSSRPGGNPFVGLLVENLDEGITTVPFTWKTAFLGKYDVFHAHWPEYLLQADSRVARSVRAAAFGSLRLLLALRRKPVLVTVHNRRAHAGAGPLQDRLAALFRRSATRRAFLNEFDRRSEDFREGDAVIPHGDYASVVAPFRPSLTQTSSEPGRVLLFGGLRANKGISMLVKAFADVADPHASLGIWGRVQDPRFLAELKAIVAEDPRVELEAREIPDRDLAVAIRSAQLIALPYPDLYNSGALFMALTLGRPVLIPDSPTARELRDEFGASSVHIFSGDLTGERIELALGQRAPSLDEVPKVLGDARSWPAIGRAYSDLYQRALDRRARTEMS
ncbi:MULTISPECIES: hypothetical protein [unclassified Pseudoclavibacter]|uniref:hypothetical protein n=1 Tax=unclassified Pseudoclavibacter TaxID=2615177 RepID=UPI001BACDB3A|nr:hypothetical protein [Pseudoclavibacter sp. Marseille-Q4354]MBS3180068.1 hypothetical protein [Pseudoclavibacter sp. Marseille-Q4354]